MNKKKNKMSFQQTLETAIDIIISRYIKVISNKYNISEDELFLEWKGKEAVISVPNDKIIKPEKNQNTSVDEPEVKDLNKCLKSELVALCKERGLKTSGTKSDLITALEGNNDNNNEKTKMSPKKTIPKIINTLKTNIETVPIRKNKFGNLEDPKTCFVFERKSRKVIGKQNPNGTIEELSKDDIDLCKKHKYDYMLPSNLDKQFKFEDEKIEELEEEEEYEEDEEDEELLEELEEEEEEDEEEDEYEEEYEYEE
jgi:hypothetical protein